MKLYEIDEAILACVDPETGEVDEDRLNGLMIARNEKLEGIAMWIKNLNSDIADLKAEEHAFAERRRKKEEKVESLKNVLGRYLNGQKFETTKVLCSFRKSQKVEISDITKIPDDYLKYSQPTADKAAIKAAIKDGLTIDGAELVDSVTMSIK